MVAILLQKCVLQSPFSNYIKILLKYRSISNFEGLKISWTFSKSYASIFLEGIFNKVRGRKVSRW